MPYIMKNIPHTYKWKVMNKKTGKVYAKATNRKKAIRQIRLLHMIEHKNYSRNMV